MVNMAAFVIWVVCYVLADVVVLADANGNVTKDHISILFGISAFAILAAPFLDGAKKNGKGMCLCFVLFGLLALISILIGAI
jgi:hypothetical protein